MLLKSSELLEKFIESEVKKIADVHMPHMPTLGSAYEEITKQGIFQDFAIPKQLDLRVVSGFVVVGGETLPEQIDCMLVHGKGTRYGLGDQYFYDIEQILCIFEVKKNLVKRDYADAITHLAKIRNKFTDHFERRLEEGYEPDIHLARRWFAQITGKSAPQHYRQIHSLSKADGILFYCLVQESLAPISVIHGYEGYTTEEGMRAAFVKILEASTKLGERVGIPGIPSLVTSNNYCLIKGNGTPFIGVRDIGEWVAVVSTRHNSAKLILEMVWTKISHYFKIGMPWGDGLHMDSVQPLLIAKGIETPQAAGWHCNWLEFKEKNLIREDDASWQPSAISPAAITLTDIMAIRGGYLPLDDGLQNYISQKHEKDLQVIIDELISTREFMIERNHLRPIHAKTHILTNDDYSGFVAHESERFDLWCDSKDIKPHYMTIFFIEE